MKRSAIVAAVGGVLTTGAGVQEIIGMLKKIKRDRRNHTRLRRQIGWLGPWTRTVGARLARHPSSLRDEGMTRSFSAALIAAIAIVLGGAPSSAQNAYITNAASNTVSVIDTATNTVVGTIPVGNFPIVFPIGVAVTPDGGMPVTEELGQSRQTNATDRVSALPQKAAVFCAAANFGTGRTLALGRDWIPSTAPASAAPSAPTRYGASEVLKGLTSHRAA